MRIYLQWTFADPTDWLSFDLSNKGVTQRAWRNLAQKPLPVGGETIDDNPGWVMALNIQGVNIWGFDHYAAEAFDPGDGTVALRAYCWNDDPVDWPVGKRQARVWEFYEPRPDARFGGQVNTYQKLTVYDEDPAEIARWTGVEASGGSVAVHPYADFVVPDTAITRHGIWVSDTLLAAHKAVRGNHDWREWAP